MNNFVEKNKNLTLPQNWKSKRSDGQMGRWALIVAARLAIGAGMESCLVKTGFYEIVARKYSKRKALEEAMMMDRIKRNAEFAKSMSENANRTRVEVAMEDTRMKEKH